VDGDAGSGESGSSQPGHILIGDPVDKRGGASTASPPTGKESHAHSGSEDPEAHPDEPEGTQTEKIKRLGALLLHKFGYIACVVVAIVVAYLLLDYIRARQLLTGAACIGESIPQGSRDAALAVLVPRLKNDDSESTNTGRLVKFLNRQLAANSKINILVTCHQLSERDLRTELSQGNADIAIFGEVDGRVLSLSFMTSSGSASTAIGIGNGRFEPTADVKYEAENAVGNGGADQVKQAAASAAGPPPRFTTQEQDLAIKPEAYVNYPMDERFEFREMESAFALRLGAWLIAIGGEPARAVRQNAAKRIAASLKTYEKIKIISEVPMLRTGRGRCFAQIALGNAAALASRIEAENHYRDVIETCATEFDLIARAHDGLGDIELDRGWRESVINKRLEHFKSAAAHFRLSNANTGHQSSEPRAWAVSTYKLAVILHTVPETRTPAESTDAIVMLLQDATGELVRLKDEYANDALFELQTVNRQSLKDRVQEVERSSQEVRKSPDEWLRQQGVRNCDLSIEKGQIVLIGPGCPQVSRRPGRLPAR
jgi:hypothetical protein